MVGSYEMMFLNYSMKNDAPPLEMIKARGLIGKIAFANVIVCSSDDYQKLERFRLELDRGLEICYHVSEPITSLAGIPSKIMAPLRIRGCLTSLRNVHRDLKQVDEVIHLLGNPIQSHVLGLFFIKNLRSIQLDQPYHTVQEILNKYLPEGRAGLPKAQNELLEAGLEDYTQV